MTSLRRQIEAFSQRGMSLGSGPIELRELREHRGRVEVENRGAAPQLGGYRVVATLRHRDGDTTVEPVPGEEALAPHEHIRLTSNVLESRYFAATPGSKSASI